MNMWDLESDDDHDRDVADQELFCERAEIREFDGLMPRAVAEKKAREDVERMGK